ncbi:Co2+/Mg2+ efflux protein ApaG [Alkalimonas collagenimarina]|uniref:Protein ApaG n=1 Tax=Alkalimonas collagenimarina TaxID=400390 RepID=A0ABT9GYF6_9GAMM|nr:Co2+/Mg2+ efflux protein ApaG [Alkalimonas collagenimarina]MDP4536088.1 Co2+/Mg2+ efflux protein ApaG [Alkalimonas collagenimarina]
MTMSTAIEIETETFYVSAQSDPEQNRYVFAYTIRIHNKGEHTVQLLRRHWLISDANGQQVEVDGEGVVGEKPTLAPNEHFSYTSGAVLDTPVGTMQGHYVMKSSTQADQPQEFKVDIPLFRLAIPNILN